MIVLQVAHRTVQPKPKQPEDMPDTLCNVRLWREHAAKLRGLSTLIADHQTRQRVMDIAAGFDRIADLAARLQFESAVPPPRAGRWLTRPILPLPMGLADLPS